MLWIRVQVLKQLVQLTAGSEHCAMWNGLAVQFRVCKSKTGIVYLLHVCMYLCVYVYIYIYTYIYTGRDIDLVYIYIYIYNDVAPKLDDLRLERPQQLRERRRSRPMLGSILHCTKLVCISNHAHYACKDM